MGKEIPSPLLLISCKTWHFPKLRFKAHSIFGRSMWICSQYTILKPTLIKYTSTMKVIGRKVLMTWCSFLLVYINKVLYLYCDNSGGQNKNRVLPKMLLALVKIKKVWYNRTVSEAAASYPVIVILVR